MGHPNEASDTQESVVVQFELECGSQGGFLAPLVKTRHFGMTPWPPWHSQEQTEPLPRNPMPYKTLQNCCMLLATSQLH